MDNTVLFGVISALASVIAYLGRDLIKQRDIAIAGWREQTAATERLADALEARNRRDEQMIRTADG